MRDFKFKPQYCYKKFLKRSKWPLKGEATSLKHAPVNAGAKKWAQGFQLGSVLLSWLLLPSRCCFCHHLFTCFVLTVQRQSIHADLWMCCKGNPLVWKMSTLVTHLHPNLIDHLDTHKWECQSDSTPCCFSGVLSQGLAYAGQALHHWAVSPDDSLFSSKNFASHQI